MLNIDIDSLLRPISAENPAGDNLEYDRAFMELERLAQPKPEQQMGGVIIPAEAPDAKAVHKHALELLTRTKDLRVAALLAQALAFAGGFAGLRDGITLVHGLLTQYWPSVHPQLDPEDDNDPTMRLTAMASLCPPSVLSALRASPLIVSRAFGPIGLREVAIANGELPQPEDGPKYETSSIEAAFQDVELDALVQVEQALALAQAHTGQIESTFDEQAGASPDLAPLKAIIAQALNVVRPRLQARQQELADQEAEAAAEAAAAANPEAVAQPSRAISGEITSRDDVLKTLDKLCAYYARHEPSSPLPLLLKRCQRLVPMSFKEIVGDLAPDALSKVELIAGKSDE